MMTGDRPFFNNTVLDVAGAAANPTLEGFVDFLSKIQARFSLQNTTYRCPSFPGRDIENPFFISTYPKTWIEHYKKEEYIKIDPAFHLGSRSLLPIDWTKLHVGGKKIRKFADEGLSAGIRETGVTIPIRGPANGIWALFTVTTDDSIDQWRMRRSALIGNMVLVSNYIHQMAYELNCQDEAIDLNAITKREREALTWIADGKTMTDVAVLMKISADTVKAHLDSACKKLGALNRTHAVTKAFRAGLVA